MRGRAFAGHVVLENLERRPRAFVSYRWRHDLSDAQELAQLFEPDRSKVDLAAIRLSGPGDEAEVSDPIDPCRVQRSTGEKVLLHCHARRAGYAVLLEEWTHGWVATLDGQPAPIERADTIFRAVRIPPGQHQVAMTYATPGLRAGALLALVGWMIFALLSGVSLYQRRPRRTGQA
jgi:hypothetical protein